MNENELAALSKTYLENREAIEEAIKKQLTDGRVQREIARDFGMTMRQINFRASRYGIHYKKRKG